MTYSDFKKEATGFADPVINMTMNANGVFEPSASGFGSKLVPAVKTAIGTKGPKLLTGAAKVTAARGVPYIPAFGPNDTVALDEHGKRQSWDDFNNGTPADANSKYTFPTYSGNNGHWEPDAQRRAWAPFSEFQPSEYSERHRKYTYKDNMTAQEKLDTFSDKAYSAASASIPLYRQAYAGVRGLFSGDKNQPYSNKDALTDEAIGSERVRRAANDFLQSLTPEDIAYYQKNMGKVDAMSKKLNMNLEGAQSFKSYIEDGMKHRLWEGVKQDWKKNLPIAANVFLRRVGLNGVADVMSNPTVFYASLAGLIGLPLMSLLFGSSKDDEKPDIPAGYLRVPYQR